MAFTLRKKPNVAGEKTPKKTGARGALRAAAIGTLLLAVALVGGSGWFVFRTLDRVSAPAAAQDGSTRAEKINMALLEKLEAADARRRSDADAIPANLPNRFRRRYAVPAAPVTQPAPIDTVPSADAPTPQPMPTPPPS